MILPTKKDALHKAWLYRVLEAIADDRELPHILYFKGGTCASMLGWLPRFSVDLDFDYAGRSDAENIRNVRTRMEKIWASLGLAVEDKSRVGIQYFLKYENDDPHGRNTLKIDASFPVFKSSKYSPQRLAEIDRIFTCQTKETMFAHKLVAPLDRFEKTGQIAGRDIFDIHHFFLNNADFDETVIKERRGIPASAYLKQLHDFIRQHITESVITEDLSFLLPSDEFRRTRKVLVRETLALLDERSQSR